MKKINILGIIAIIVFIASIIGTFGDFKEGAIDGWNHTDQMRSDSIYRNPNKVTYTHFNVQKLEDSIQSKVANKQLYMNVPYEVNSISTYVEPSTWHNILQMLLFPLAIALLYGFYCLIHFLISISKKEVFTDMNVHRIRWLVYSLFATQLIVALINWLAEQAAIAQINLPGYEIVSNAFMEIDWISMIVTILLTEIFAIGTKIKEEQDLTI